MPDFTETKRPIIQPPKGAKGDEAIAGDKPFIMHPDGVGWIWVTSGLKDGPLPAHYEPLESPVDESALSGHADQSCGGQERTARQCICLFAGDPRFPYVLTTYRLTEHHTAGGMSRTSAASGGTAAGTVLPKYPRNWRRRLDCTTASWLTITTMRGIIEARALVTPRIQAAADRWPTPCIRWACHITGATRAWSQATSPTICWPFPRSPTCASWKPKRWYATSVPGGVARAISEHWTILETETAEAGMSHRLHF